MTPTVTAYALGNGSLGQKGVDTFSDDFVQLCRAASEGQKHGLARDIEWNLPTDAYDRQRFVTFAKVHTLLESEPLRALRDRFILLYHGSNVLIDHRGFMHLQAVFPEVTWRIVSSDFPDWPALRVKDDEAGRTRLAADVAAFAAGHREWFDPLGARRAARAKMLLPATAQASDRPHAYIIDDETEYADILAYAAHRTGRLQTSPVRSFESLEALKQRLADATAGTAQRGAIVHAFDLELTDSELPAYTRLRELTKHRAFWDSLIGPHALRRTVVTGNTRPERTLQEPSCAHDAAYPDLRSRSVGWTESLDGRSILRGISKPVGWIHDIGRSGLFECVPTTNATHTFERALLDAFFDGVCPTLAEGQPSQVLSPASQGHSASAFAGSVAQHLLARARRARGEHEPLFAALMALEAVRWLRGRSPTLFIDAVSTLYLAEATAEADFACAAGDGRRAVRLRAAEFDALLRLLDAATLAPSALLHGLRQRTWNSLRVAYQVAGALDAADEALLELHRARRQAGFRKVRSLLARVPLVLNAARRLQTLWRHEQRHDSLLRRIVWWCAWYVVSPIALSFLVVTAVAWPDAQAIVLCIVLTGLVVTAWIDTPWRIAIVPTQWLGVALASAILLTAGHIALLAEPGVNRSDPHTWRFAFTWTLAELMNTSVKPEWFEQPGARLATSQRALLDRSVRSKVDLPGMLTDLSLPLSPLAPPRPSAIVLLPTNVTAETSTETHVENHPSVIREDNYHTWPEYIFWFTKSVTACLLFAFGLSAIYRKAIRS